MHFERGIMVGVADVELEKAASDELIDKGRTAAPGVVPAVVQHVNIVKLHEVAHVYRKA